MKFIFLSLIVLAMLRAETWSVVYITTSMNLKKSDIINIYFKRLKQKNGCSIVALNLSSSHPARQAFLKQVLGSDLAAWSQYYDELYFRGIRSPIVVKSEESVVKYLQRLDGVVAYIPTSKVEAKYVELVRFNL